MPMLFNKIEKYLILVFLLHLFSCQEKDFKDIVGSYGVGGFGGADTLIFKPDGEFKSVHWLISCLGSDHLEIIEGNYTIKDAYIFLSPKKLRVKDYEYDEPSNKKLIGDSTYSIHSFRDFYDSMIIVPWNNKVFLFGANKATLKNPGEFLGGSISSFLNSVNRGDTIDFTKHYFQKPSESTQQDLRLALPKEWRDYIIKTELKVKIIKVDSTISKLGNDITLTYPLITIDAGKNQGVHIGYELYSNGGNPRNVRIVEVHDNYSKGVTFLGKPKECKVGLSLSTRLIQKN